MSYNNLVFDLGTDFVNFRKSRLNRPILMSCVLPISLSIHLVVKYEVGQTDISHDVLLNKKHIACASVFNLVGQT